MAKKSKWFRVALEGATTDGREITRQDITDMASTYSRETYGARVNVEHFRGIVPGGVFDMLGDVLALKAQEDELQIGGKTEKRLALYAEIEPLPALVDLAAKGQKIFTSCEIQPDFAKTGKAGFVGLAVTDSPASLGTEVLKFASKNPAIFSARKQAEGNLFTEAVESCIEFVDVDDASADSEVGKTFSSFRKFLDTISGKVADVDARQQNHTQNNPPAKVDEGQSSDAPALVTFAAEMTKFSASVEKALADLATGQKAQADQFAALQSKLESEPDNRTYSRRAPTGGGSDRARAVY